MTSKLSGHYGTLLLILMASLMGQAFVGDGRVASVFMDLTFFAVFIVTLPAIWNYRKVRMFALTLGVFAVLASTTGRSLGVDGAFPLGAGTRALFYILLMYIIFYDILTRPQIDMDAVFGSCCVYILLGVTWSVEYSVLEWLYPGSFHFSEFAEAAGFGPTTTGFKLEYFSLITLSSVGYGEIVPISPLAKMSAALEGISGQLFLAIIIGRLVGLAVSNRNSPPAD